MSISQDTRRPSSAENPANLTERERQVVAGIARGLTNQEIAEELYISINSVKTHVRMAYRRMGVKRRPQAIVWALTHMRAPGDVSSAE